MANRQSSGGNWFKKYWYFLLAFVPMIQWMPCFVMNGKARLKRWLFMGIAYIAIGLGCFVALIAVQSWSTNNYVRYPTGPSESDYMDFTYDDFENTDGSIDWDAYYAAEKEFRKTDAYKEYQKDLDDFYASPEYKEAEALNSRRYRIEETATGICVMIVIIKYFIYAVWIYFVERYRFVDALKSSNSKQQVYQRIANNTANSTRDINNNWQNMSNSIVSNQSATPQTTPTPVRTRPESDVVPDMMSGILNVNEATEEEIEALPLISVVDAKRIMEYRNTHGAFGSVDEFFQSFAAKPHVVVKLQEMLTVSQVVTRMTESVASPNKKRFDL